MDRGRNILVNSRPAYITSSRTARNIYKDPISKKDKTRRKEQKRKKRKRKEKRGKEKKKENKRFLIHGLGILGEQSGGVVQERTQLKPSFTKRQS